MTSDRVPRASPRPWLRVGAPGLCRTGLIRRLTTPFATGVPSGFGNASAIAVTGLLIGCGPRRVEVPLEADESGLVLIATLTADNALATVHRALAPMDELELESGTKIGILAIPESNIHGSAGFDAIAALPDVVVSRRADTPGASAGQCRSCTIPSDTDRSVVTSGDECPPPPGLQPRFVDAESGDEVSGPADLSSQIRLSWPGECGCRATPLDPLASYDVEYCGRWPLDGPEAFEAISISRDGSILATGELGRMIVDPSGSRSYAHWEAGDPHFNQGGALFEAGTFVISDGLSTRESSFTRVRASGDAIAREDELDGLSTLVYPRFWSTSEATFVGAQRRLASVNLLFTPAVARIERDSVTLEPMELLDDLCDKVWDFSVAVGDDGRGLGVAGTRHLYVRNPVTKSWFCTDTLQATSDVGSHDVLSLSQVYASSSGELILCGTIDDAGVATSAILCAASDSSPEHLQLRVVARTGGCTGFEPTPEGGRVILSDGRYVEVDEAGVREGAWSGPGSLHPELKGGVQASGTNGQARAFVMADGSLVRSLDGVSFETVYSGVDPDDRGFVPITSNDGFWVFREGRSPLRASTDCRVPVDTATVTWSSERVDRAFSLGDEALLVRGNEVSWIDLSSGAERDHANVDLEIDEHITGAARVNAWILITTDQGRLFGSKDLRFTPVPLIWDDPATSEVETESKYPFGPNIGTSGAFNGVVSLSGHAWAFGEGRLVRILDEGELRAEAYHTHRLLGSFELPSWLAGTRVNPRDLVFDSAVPDCTGLYLTATVDDTYVAVRASAKGIQLFNAIAGREFTASMGEKFLGFLTASEAMVLASKTRVLLGTDLPSDLYWPFVVGGAAFSGGHGVVTGEGRIATVRLQR